MAADQGGFEAVEILTNLKSCLSAMTPFDVAIPGGQGGQSICTVGLMLSGCVVEDTMPGSPAFSSGQIGKGDVITEVDSHPVTDASIIEAIRGSDIVGSPLKLQLRCADHSLKSVTLVRMLRTQVLMRRDAMMCLDEVRASAGSQIVQQRGAKKVDDALLRHLNKSVESMAKAMDSFQQSEQEAQERALRLTGYINRVSDVTVHYLDRMEDSLASGGGAAPQRADRGSEAGGQGGYTVSGGGTVLVFGAGGGAGAGVRVGEKGGAIGGAEAGMWEAEVAAARNRVREESERCKAAEAKHSKEMAMMKAEVQTLQDQLNISRALGKEVTPAAPGDLTLSSQLTTCKVKLAKASAELELAKESIQAKNQALAVSQVELRTAQETRKADLEQMREAKERMARLEAEAKNLRNEGIRQRHETEGVAANAGRASLEVEVSRLSEMLDGERERAERLESALNQARDEARILLRQRQAHFSAVAQVEADLIVESPASGDADADANAEAAQETGEEPSPENGAAEKDEDKDKDKDKDKAVKGGEGGEEGDVPRSKYEAALVKIGAMTRKAKEMEAAMASVAGGDKGEAQKLARSAAEAKHALEAEASKRDAEVKALQLEIESVKARYEKKLSTADAARVKLQQLNEKTQQELTKVQETAKKDGEKARADMEGVVARHRVAWQKTAEAVDQFGKEAEEAKSSMNKAAKERDALAKKFEEARTQAADAAKEAASEAERLAKVAAEAEAVAAAKAEEREKAADEKIKAGAIECELRLNALQEQLRGAHDNVSDAYAMMAKAQAECVSNVEAARAAEREARKEAKEQVVKHGQELKRVQRQLAGVTGSKDDEIERLETRVATLEVTIKSRNAEVRALQSQGEEVQAELEKTQEKRREAEDGLAAAKRKISRLEEDVKYAQENAKEAVMLSADRERQVLDGMRGELGEEGMLEAALERAREECDDLRKRAKEAEEAADRAPSSRLEMECSAMKSQIAALEKDLVESKGLVNRLRREERERIEEMQRQVEAGGGGGGSGGGVARELDSMLQVRLEVSELRGKLQDSEDEVTRLGEELDGLRREADEAVVSGQKIRSEAAVRVEESVNAERAETRRVKGELELVLKQLLDARSKLTEMEGWKGKAERAQEALEAERVKRLEDVKEAEEEAAVRQKEWKEAMSEVEARSHEWRRNAEEGDWGRVKQLEAEAEELRLAAIEEMENLQARIDDLEEDAKERAKEAEERESDLKLQMTMMSKEAAKAAGASRALLETAQGKLKERDGTIRGLQTQIATYEQAQHESFEEVQQLRQQVRDLQHQAVMAHQHMSSLHTSALDAHKVAISDLLTGGKGTTGGTAELSIALGEDEEAAINGGSSSSSKPKGKGKGKGKGGQGSRIAEGESVKAKKVGGGWLGGWGMSN